MTTIKKVLIQCPQCLSRARIATSKLITNETREVYCQCLNLNCSKTFVAHISFSHFTEPTGRKPDPELQPELCKDLKQLNMFDET